VSFEVASDLYGRFMGRYSEPLAVSFAEASGVDAGQRILDVGCGPGALTAQLVERVGVGQVAAIDPSALFVEAARSRFPGLDVLLAAAENLPFPDDLFDAALAQLVVHFMADPVAGLREMARVTRPGGTVAACVWDFGGGNGPLSTFWSAVHDVDPEADDESGLAGVREGQLVELATEAGLADPTQSVLSVSVHYADFYEWWEPYTFGIGPAGSHVARLEDEERDVLRARCEELLPAGSFDVVAKAWCMTASAS
jgi:ubiquinone/menaquinone biosynthesis C-methylase UbiE